MLGKCLEHRPQPVLQTFSRRLCMQFLVFIFLAMISYQQKSIPAPPDVAKPPADAQNTASGVASKVLKSGPEADHPKANDCVKVHFTVWQRNGTMLTSSRLRDAAEIQCLRTAFPGVAEALQSMVIGEQRRLWVPSHLTFTSRDEGEERPRPDLTIDIELISILKAPPTPSDLKTPPKTAVKTSSGIAFQILQKGTGTVHPSSA